MRLVSYTDENDQQSDNPVVLEGQVQADDSLDSRPLPAEDPNWPHAVDMILSALDAATFEFETDTNQTERRSSFRRSYRQNATITLHSDPSGSPGWELFTRDCHPHGLGFITQHNLPLGYSGLIELIDPSGNEASLQCTIIRCREAATGWFEGAVRFARKQEAFGA